ncbi:(Fe-S)-binding protein [Ornithinibacillus scapharcae]|uniref:(Fe-S)-binding protein n=1 Tax=Ornithinibacillus scapharcae TaxID=1147159 RepID=UPI000225AB20|nr:(Fe-S)-binding protein [Ornithinibacillus scapharcae]
MKPKEKNDIANAFKENMDYNELLNCTRCGFCLSSCPTYIETNMDETHSPRGRIALMKAVVDGVIEPDMDVKHSLDLCLGCRACEPVCPSGVQYGHLLEQARESFYQHKKTSLSEKFTHRFILNSIFPKQERMIKSTSLLGFYQRSGLQKLTRNSGILDFFPETMKTMDKVLPKVPSRNEMKNRPNYLPPPQHSGMRVAFFSGCLMDTIFLETNNATLKLLQYAGCEVVIPQGQNCCGALHGHSGELEKAKEMARNNILTFENTKAEYIVTNAGGCGAFLLDYHYLLRDDPLWSKRAEEFSMKIIDISSILMKLDFSSNMLKLDEQIVTYQDSCHLRNGQKTYLEHRQLLTSIQGVKYVEMKDADKCCGSAGIYNLLESEMSLKILDDKMRHVRNTNATTIVTANPGCLLQLLMGIEREGLSHTIRAVHIVDLLLEALENNN